MIEITEDNYVGMVTTLSTVAGSLLKAAELIDVAELRGMCERFQALAPVLEPTAYHRGGRLNLADQAAFLKAVDEFVTAVRRLDRRADTPPPCTCHYLPHAVNCQYRFWLAVRGELA